MKWTRLVGLLALAIGVSGCATSAHRDRLDLPGERSMANPRTTRTATPRPVLESVPAQADDLVAQSAATTPGRFDRFRARYLNPFGRSDATAPYSTGRSTPAPAPVVEVAARVQATDPTPTGWTSWFGPRRPKAPTTYLTDARTDTGRSAVVPTRLPGLLADRGTRTADRAVTPTSAEGPAPTSPTTSAFPEPPSEGPALAASGVGIVSAQPLGDPNPDSSTAKAEPLRTDEPRLAVAPITATPAASPEPATSAPSAAEAIPAASQEPVASAAEAAPSSDPESQFPERLRGRPRMASSSMSTPAPRPARASAPASARSVPLFGRRQVATPSAPADAGVQPTTAVAVAGPESAARAGEVAESAESDPAPTPVPAEAQRKPSGDPSAVRAVPTPADPGRSLGLPELVLPASYSKHGAGVIQGSGQSIPPPVLASPQVEPSPQVGPTPQSAAGPPGVVATATKAKSKFCLFLRKCLCLDKKKMKKAGK